MQSHYKTYPPNKRYRHIVNFVQTLYKMYMCKCDDDQFGNNKSSILYLAIVKFLTRIYPRKLREVKDGLTRTQYMLILPEDHVHDKQFIERALRPLLEEASWVPANECKSKLLFTSNWECYLYSIQSSEKLIRNDMRLQRERKYIICNIQKMAKQSKFLVTLETIQMVYDPDFVDASQGSIATLDKNALLSPKILNKIASLEIPVNCFLNKMEKVAKSIFLKVFAETPTDVIGNDTLIDYYSSNKYYPACFMLQFLTCIRIEDKKNVSSI